VGCHQIHHHATEIELTMEKGFILLVLAAATGGILAILPSVADIRGAGPGTEVAHDLHTGLFIGAVAITALSALAAFEDKSPKPLLMAGIAITAVVGAYEYVLKSRGIVVQDGC
jgi:hypothetical protein